MRCNLLTYKSMLPMMRHHVFCSPVRPCVNCYVTLVSQQLSCCSSIQCVCECFSVISVFGLVTAGWVTRPLCTLTLSASRPGLSDPSLSSLNIFKNCPLGAGWSTYCIWMHAVLTLFRHFPFFLLPLFVIKLIKLVAEGIEKYAKMEMHVSFSLCSPA